jgi:hypothetical protein
MHVMPGSVRLLFKPCGTATRQRPDLYCCSREDPSKILGKLLVADADTAVDIAHLIAAKVPTR